jgi:hypothetical protein
MIGEGTNARTCARHVDRIDPDEELTRMNAAGCSVA